MLVAGLAAVLLGTGVADGKPRQTEEVVRYGFMAQLAGAGCAPATLARAVDGHDAIRFEPRLGDLLGEETMLSVTDVRLEGGQASWTIMPRWYECELHAGDPAWAWTTERRDWAVTYEARLHAVRTRPSGRVRSIARFRVDRHGRRAPTVRRARRALGRPSSVRRRGVVCRARWRRLGLVIDFVNLGGANPCRRGFAQQGRVRGGRADDWTAVIGRNAGVAVGTDDAYLDETFTGEPDPGARARILAEVYVPYGEGGLVPTVRALLDSRGRVKGFDFWIGAAGD
jgi:hypothetical protein